MVVIGLLHRNSMLSIFFSFGVIIYLFSSVLKLVITELDKNSGVMQLPNFSSGSAKFLIKHPIERIWRWWSATQASPLQVEQMKKNFGKCPILPFIISKYFVWATSLTRQSLEELWRWWKGSVASPLSFHPIKSTQGSISKMTSLSSSSTSLKRGKRQRHEKKVRGGDVRREINP